MVTTDSIDMARRLKFDKVEVRMDSTEVVHHVQEKRNAQRYGNNMLSKVGGEYQTYSQEANQLADAMANFSYSLKDSYNLLWIVQTNLGNYIEQILTKLVVLELLLLTELVVLELLFCSLFLLGS